MFNKYIEHGYEFFKGLASSLLLELRKDKKDIIVALDHKDITTAIVGANKDISNAVVGVEDQLLNVIKAIEDKPVIESVEISNLDELSGKVGQIIDTLKEELGKLDKEIVVKNDLSQLTALFKSGQDKKDLIKALERIEKKIKSPEIADYTLILSDLATAVENIYIPECNLTEISNTLIEIKEQFLKEPVDHLAKYAKYDRLKVVLSDEQIKKMAPVVTVGNSGGGGRIYNVAGGQINPSTAEKQDEQTAVLESVGGFNIPKYDEIAVTYPTTATEVYTYKLATVTKATITVTYSDAVSKLIISGIVKS